MQDLDKLIEVLIKYVLSFNKLFVALFYKICINQFLVVLYKRKILI